MSVRNVSHFVTVLCFLQTLQAWGNPFAPDHDYLKPPQQELVEKFKALQEEARRMRRKSLSQYLPPPVRKTTTSRGVASQVAELSARQILESEEFRQSALGSSAESLDQRWSGNIGLGGSAENNSEKDKAGHSLQFQLRSTQSRASVRYAGFGQTVVSYTLYTQALQVEMGKDLASRWRISADHLSSPEEKTQRIKLEWSW